MRDMNIIISTSVGILAPKSSEYFVQIMSDTVVVATQILLFVADYRSFVQNYLYT